MSEIKETTGSSLRNNLVSAQILTTCNVDVMWFQDFFANQKGDHKSVAIYGRVAKEFTHWCLKHHLTALSDVEPVHVERWINHLKSTFGVSAVRSRLVALRHIFAWFVSCDILPTNPAAATRGPRQVLRNGKSIVLDAATVRTLMSSMGGMSPANLRDRAFVGLMLNSFAWVDVLLKTKRRDVFAQGQSLRVRIPASGRKFHEIHCNAEVEAYLGDYVEAIGPSCPRKALFRTIDRNGKLTGSPLHTDEAHEIVQRRMRAIGIDVTVGCGSFRATGITVLRPCHLPANLETNSIRR